MNAVWFVTRKYPPSIGGMEKLSYEVTTRIAARRPSRILALRGNQAWLPVFVVASAVRVAIGVLRRRIAVLHLGDPVLAPVGALARAGGVPVCVTVHGLDVTFAHPLYRLWLRMFFRDLDAYACISAAARDAAIASGVAPDRTTIIGIGIAPTAVPGIPREGDLLLFVGRLVARKGVAWFLGNVLPRVLARRPDVRMVVVGDGPARSRCESAAREAGVAEHVTFAGAVDHETKAQWLARAAVCVMPNVPVQGDIEGYGIAALEAAAAGCPLVAASLEGLVDAIEPGRGGTLLPSGDVNSWTDSLVSLLADPDRARSSAEAARAWVLRERGWDAVCDAYERLFDRLASLRDRGR